MIKYKNGNKNRWVDLSNLPQSVFKNENHIKWEDSIGCIIPFQYDEVVDNIRIVGYKQETTKQHRHRAILSIIIGKYVVNPIDVRSDFITNCQLHNLVSNRIINKAPELVQYLDCPDDAYKYSCQSNQKICMRCPICGHRELKHISNVYRYGFTCFCTADGISIPNKIMFNILQQLNISFINEASKSHGFKWMQNYLYDFYFKIGNKPILIEMDGFFHKFQQERDRIKTQLAENHGFELIRIDCDYSNVDAIDYIKQNIINSKLSKLLPLNQIDWNLCKKAAVNSLVTDSCRLWEINKMSISDIANKLGVDRHTVAKYLQRGKDVDLCPSYNDFESRRRGAKLRETSKKEYEQHNKMNKNNEVISKEEIAV